MKPATGHDLEPEQERQSGGLQATCDPPEFFWWPAKCFKINYKYSPKLLYKWTRVTGYDHNGLSNSGVKLSLVF